MLFVYVCINISCVIIQTTATFHVPVFYTSSLSYIQILRYSSLSLYLYQNCAAVAAVTGGIVVDVLSIVVGVAASDAASAAVAPAAAVVAPAASPVVVVVDVVAVLSCGSRVYQECLSVNSPHRDSKNFRMPCPALPTGESSSLNISQLSKICRTSTQKSSRHL